MKKLDLVGKRFGKAVVVGDAPNARLTTGRSMPQWTCLCDCGVTFIRMAANLKRGNSCGCLSRPHGLYGTRTHRIWLGMMQRCYASHEVSFRNYGARGIKVCKEWHDPKAFSAAWPELENPEYSIDRIDNDGDYTPQNTRAATRIEQANNKRNNILLTLGDRTQALSDWCRYLGVPPSRVRARLQLGWTEVDALILPKLENKHESKNLRDICL